MRGADMPKRSHFKSFAMSSATRKGRQMVEADTTWMSQPTGKVTVLDNGCWQLGSGRKYPKIKVQGHEERVHRLVYLAIHGPIPEDWHIHHQCENPTCINPDHLEAMSPGDHTRHHQPQR